jgi:hypothetical protein
MSARLTLLALPRRLAPVFAVGALALLPSCATIVTGTRENVSVTSTPEGATVQITTAGGFPIFEGRTPAYLQMAKDKDYTVTVSVPGYQDARVGITRDFEAWTLANIFCGLWPVVIDLASGAYKHLTPNEIVVSLSPLPAGYAQNDKNRDGVGEGLSVLLVARDDAGELRVLNVPLTPSETVATRAPATAVH